MANIFLGPDVSLSLMSLARRWDGNGEGMVMLSLWVWLWIEKSGGSTNTVYGRFYTLERAVGPMPSIPFCSWDAEWSVEQEAAGSKIASTPDHSIRVIYVLSDDMFSFPFLGKTRKTTFSTQSFPEVAVS